jgi:HTH-type transcriptional regulator/antitoxin HigA
MNIKPIKTARDHEAALREIETLMMAKPGTAAGDRLDVLVTLIEAYEHKHFPMDAPDPIAAIRLAMERNDLKPRDLVPMIGGLNRVHEILTGRRGLTLAMIRRLHDGLGIPAESLIRPSKRRAAA